MTRFIKHGLVWGMLVMFALVFVACDQSFTQDRITITFETNGGNPIDPIIADKGSTLSDFVPVKAGDAFLGWYLENTFETNLDQAPSHDVTMYAKWLLRHVDVVTVGDTGTTYTIPIGITDNDTATVEGGYEMVTTQTTYELWHEVRIWAQDNHYHFENIGREGHSGDIGAPPTSRRRHRPVTTISWRDVVVWTNALSEMTGHDPVYRTSSGDVIRDSRDANGSVVDAAVHTPHNGYRLPTSHEWEMAARWRDDNGDGAMLTGGRYWTPGSYASGATADVNDETATGYVSWYQANAGNRTRTVGTKAPNHLGIHDMSGNVLEWTFTSYLDVYRIYRGCSFAGDSNDVQLGQAHVNHTYSISILKGFRIARTR